ncbi:DUF6286 domain-containing protein [Yinghuangia soli]|uniref:Alkaline shock response membrane anchor protein AmaP n=1 Tax=Yinghuangia soli TaxID=2908204 RepID=A0AA41Q891_9ACTN|nr:DUF6286 domain-containing protein [Yinghuangia soli]MCF2533036.1 alkaline shock response membrane anchor protein AmaP [Yinghuangia soli]
MNVLDAPLDKPGQPGGPGDPADPGQPDDPNGPAEAGPGAVARKPRRAWSPRGFVAALTALVLGGAAGVLLYFGIAARLERTPQWAYDTLDWVQTHKWSEQSVWVGGAIAAVLGLWLLVLAWTPGRRHLLPLQPVGPDMTAYMTRRTAGNLLRHTALSSTGVLDARVRVTRRKAVLRVDYHFRDPDELHDELETALRARADALLLARVPRVDVRLQPSSGR